MSLSSANKTQSKEMEILEKPNQINWKKYKNLELVIMWTDNPPNADIATAIGITHLI